MYRYNRGRGSNYGGNHEQQNVEMEVLQDGLEGHLNYCEDSMAHFRFK